MRIQCPGPNPGRPHGGSAEAGLTSAPFGSGAVDLRRAGSDAAGIMMFAVFDLA
jgi:hypothetical protein